MRSMRQPTADVAVGALEPQFFAALLEGLEIDPESLPAQGDRKGWPMTRLPWPPVRLAEPRRWAEAFGDRRVRGSGPGRHRRPKPPPQQGAKVFVEGRRSVAARSGPQILSHTRLRSGGTWIPRTGHRFPAGEAGYSGTEIRVRRVGAVA